MKDKNNKVSTTEEMQNHVIKTEKLKEDFECCVSKATHEMEKFFLEISYEDYGFIFKNLLNHKKELIKNEYIVIREFHNRFETLIYFAKVN